MGVDDRYQNGPAMGRSLFNGGVARVTDEIQVDGERYRELKNGAIYDLSIGRIVANPGGGTTAITQANSSEMREVWRAQRIARAQEAITDHGKGDLGAGVKELTVAQVNLAADPDRGRASTEAYKTVLTAAGMWDRPGQSANNLANSTQITLPNDIAHRILDIIAERTTLVDK